MSIGKSILLFYLLFYGLVLLRFFLNAGAQCWISNRFGDIKDAIENKFDLEFIIESKGRGFYFETSTEWGTKYMQPFRMYLLLISISKGYVTTREEILKIQERRGNKLSRRKPTYTIKEPK